MGMSDCDNCWSTPCICGWGYRWWTVKRLDNFIEMLSKVREFVSNNPYAKFSKDFSCIGHTVDDKRFIKFM